MRRVLNILMTGFLLLLAACTAADKPGQFADVMDSPKGKTVPPVMWQELTGMPPNQAQQLKNALAIAAGQHDIGLVEGDFQTGTYSLSGNLQATVAAGVAQVSFSFQLSDDKAAVIETIAGVESAGPASGSKPWASVTPAVLDRIASITARQMAVKLGQLGFATRLSALILPPAHTFAKAGPNAHKEIDFETLNGPGAVDPTATAAVPAADDVAMAAPETDQPDKPVIRAVAVVPVKGSSGSGNADLTKAMRKTLSAAGWPVATARAKDALTILGQAELFAPKDGKQQVVLLWTVQTPDGKSLGDVQQANVIPANSLGSGWGSAASAVTAAAAPAIVAIINKYR